MIVLIDAGNSNVKLALLKIDGEIERIAIERFEALSSSVQKVFYASVKKTFELEKILNYCRINNIYHQEIKVSETFKQIECGYKKFENLGVDRWLAVIAARTLYTEINLIIVDAGTAITVDVCKGNQHLGGWIAPGLKLMQDSIIEKAPGVFSKPNMVNETFGTDTPSALLQGCSYSLVGMIQQAEILVKQMQKNNEDSTKIILTGGDATSISRYLTANVKINEDLLFIGMKQFV